MPQRITVEERDDTRERIKQAARMLFADRGIDGVSIREILAAAGQRNAGAVGYYFQNKDALIREILSDGALLNNRRRTSMLDDLERGKACPSLRDVIAVIVRSEIEYETVQEAQSYIRFFTMLRLHDPALFADVVIGHQDASFRRCIAHMRTLCGDLPPSIFSERIRFMLLMVAASLSVRELAMASEHDQAWALLLGGRSWSSPALIEGLIDACEAVVSRPVSNETAALLATSAA